MKAYTENLYFDDYADIVRDYKVLLGYKVSNERTYEIIKDYYYHEYKDCDDERIFWIVLAEFQASYGILMDEVKEKALFYLSATDGISKEELLVYPEIIKLVESPNPFKLIRKPPYDYRSKTEFKIGDIFAIKINPLDDTWGGNRDDWDKASRYMDSQKKLSNKYVYFKVIDIDKVPVSHIMPELDYCSMPVIQLLDVVTENINDYSMDTDYSVKKIISNIYKNPPEKVNSVVLMPYTKKTLERFGEISLIGNAGFQSYDAGGSCPYIDISNVILELVWTFMY